MITLKDFKKYEALEQELKTFLFEKCEEYDEAKWEVNGNVDDLYKDQEFEDDFDFCEFNGLFLEVFFMEYRTFRGEGNQYRYYLPLDIVFEPDFKDKMKVRLEEEKEKERQILLEKRRQNEEAHRRLAEQKKIEEIKTMRELMRKYPEECK
jgi:hypothetical protein